MIVVLFTMVIAFNLYMGFAKVESVFNVYRVMVIVIQLAIFGLLAFALFRIRHFMKMLKMKHIFPNEFVIFTFLIAEGVIGLGHIL